MSLVKSDSYEDLEQLVVGPQEQKKYRRGPRFDRSVSRQKGLAVIVVDNFKYIFKSQNQRTLFRTWGCSFKPSCKASITVNNNGDVIWASDDHSHPALSDQQIRTVSTNEVLLHKEVKKGTHFEAVEGMEKRLGNFSDCSIHESGSRSAENMAVESSSQEENRTGDSAQSETGYSEGDSFEEQDTALPKLGPAFSVAGCKDMIMMNSAMPETKMDESSGEEASLEKGAQSCGIEVKGSPVLSPVPNLANLAEATGSLAAGNLHTRASNISGNGNKPLAWNPTSAVLHQFSVAKSTLTMRNIIAQALQRLDEESLDEPVEEKAGSSKGSRGWQSEKTEPKEESDTEEEWQWQIMKQGPDEDEDEEEEGEINVEVSEQEEQDSYIDEDEMAIILGE